MKTHKQAGFTLIEVLAALMIFSVAIIGLSHSGTQSLRTVNALDNKMLAGIVADNQLILARQTQLQVSSKNGEEGLMSRDFTFDLTVSKTENPNFLKMVIKVRLKNQPQALIERTAFVQGKIS